jgi:hypothetical protein
MKHNLSFQVLSTGAEDFCEALGISESRSDELKDIAINAIVNSNRPAEGFAEISQKVNTPQELVVVTNYFTQAMSNPLIAIARKVKKDKKKGGG